jgi:hypothetical protein
MVWKLLKSHIKSLKRPEIISIIEINKKFKELFEELEDRNENKYYFSLLIYHIIFSLNGFAFITLE